MNSIVKSILIVEDDLLTQKSISLVLSKSFDTVLTANNGKEGLDIYNEEKPDLVLTDIAMPEMDGIEMIKRIKAGDSEAKIIILSSHHDPKILVESIELGVDGYLFKPFNPEKFFATVQKIEVYLKLQNQLSKQQTELEHHEQQYRSLFETAPIGIIIIDQFGEIININKQLIEILKTDKDFSKGDNIFEFTPLIRSGFSAAFMESMETDRVVVKQYDFITRTDEQIHISYQIAPIHIDDRDTIYQAIVEDTTIRHNNEYQINYQRSLLDSVLNNIPDLIAYKDAHGKYLGVNKAFTDFVGISEDLIHNRLDADIFNKEKAAYFSKNEDKAVLKKQGSRYRGFLNNAKFEKLYFETIKSPFSIGSEKVAGTIAVSRDLTENLNHINALKYSEERYRGLVESQNDLVIRISKDNTITYINDAYCSKFKIERTEVIGQVPMAFHLNRKQLEDFFALNTKEHTNRMQTVEVVYLKDGEAWISWDFYGVTNADGEVIEIQGVGRDITEIKKTEEKLHEANQELQLLHDNLEKQVKEVVNDIRDKDHMLIKQSRQAAMGEMIGNIAHQWRQPINSLGLIVQNMKTAFENDKLTGDYIKEKVNKVMDLIRYMSETIDDFKDFFKPQYAQSTFILGEVIDKTVKFIESNFEHNNIPIYLEGKSDLVLSGFPNELSQVMLNILVNAKDNFIEKQKSNPQIRILTKTGKSAVTISIRDNGGGIEEEVLEKIFEPYFTTKDQGKGTGLGLYMAKTIIEKNLNGTLVASNSDEGACFDITLDRSV
jgi:PAS domain S-box-containing protein